MAANVETMFSVREKPWHGLGTIVSEAPTSADAIKLAGLDWDVISRPVFTETGLEILGYKSNVRSSDNSILGIVSDKYKIVQNSEAFEFVDNLLGEGITFETAGSLKRGKCVWLLAKMPATKILGDDIEPYLCFTNSHDGTGAIKVVCCHTRVVCNNTLNIALAEAKRSWSTKHMGDIQSKLHEAEITLGLANAYTDALTRKADVYANTKLSEGELESIINELFPIDAEKDTQRKINNMQTMRDNFQICYMMPDIAQFRGTQWGAINAMADMVDHMAPIRSTDTYQENNWGRIIGGHPILDELVNKLAALPVAA